MKLLPQVHLYGYENRKWRKIQFTGLTHHFWLYIFHTTAPHKLSTLLEGGP